MLVKETAKPNEVVSIKLITGEEILGKLVSASNEAVTIAQPFSMIMQQNQQGQQELGMIPYCIAASESDITFNVRNMTTFPAKVSRNFADGWISQTSKILQPPSAGKIIS